MTSLKLILPALITIFLLQACHKGLLGINGKGSNIEESRQLSGFTNIDLRCDANVEYVQDSTYSVVISAQKNILEVLRTRMDNERLTIDFTKNVYRHNTIRIVIHSPSLQSLSLSGSGNITSKTAIKANGLELRISGSGDISVPFLTAQSLTAKISGSGNITVSGGTATNEVFSVSGSGNITTIAVLAATNSTKISGSGNVSTHPSDALNLTISGSGSLTYTGNPAINSSITGSGKLIHI